MPTNTLTAPHMPATAERLGSLTERIWHGADLITHGRMQQAMRLQQDKGETATPQSAIDLARSLQLKAMHEADTDDWTTSKLTANRVALLLLGIPAAARAQDRMDTHTSRDRSLDIASLSRFNDDFTDTLTEMPASMMVDFPERLMRRTENLLENTWHLPILTEKQFGRIANGLAHEVAVLRALQKTLPEGWSIRKGDTQEDMRGTDFVVYDPDGRELRMDVKSRVAFDHAVTDLEAGRWIPPHIADKAHNTGVVYSRTRVPEGGEVFTCVFDADMLGAIENYNYHDPEAVFSFVERQFKEQGQTRLRKLGKHAINI